MYERFTDRARNVMRLANQEAQRFNHEYVGTEHVLLGLISETGVATTVLQNLNVDLPRIRLEVEKLIQSGPDMVTMGRLPVTPAAKRAIENAMQECRKLSITRSTRSIFYWGYPFTDRLVLQYTILRERWCHVKRRCGERDSSWDRAGTIDGRLFGRIPCSTAA